MSWTEVRVTKESFSFELQVSGGSTRLIGVGQRTWLCTSDAVVYCDAACSADDGTTAVALLGEGFSPAQPNAGCVKLASKPLSSVQFEVIGDFKDDTGGQSEATLLGLPAKITQTEETFMEAYGLDAEDTPVRNTAGEPFDSFPERQNAIRVYTIEKYVNGTTKAAVEAAIRTNNDSAKTINGFVCDTDTLYLSSASFDEVQSFYKMTMLVKWNKNGWKDEPLNYGYSELVGGNLKKIKINGQPITKAWPLNLDGTKMASPTATPVKVSFYPNPQAAWTGVPLS